MWHNQEPERQVSDKTNTNESSLPASEPRPYSPPRLKFYGTVGEMTASGSGATREGGARETNRFP